MTAFAITAEPATTTIMPKEPTNPPAATLYVAAIHTRNFSFLALGDSDASAREALMRGWAAHCKQTLAQPDYIGKDDINVTELAVGQCSRDGTVLEESIRTPDPDPTPPDLYKCGNPECGRVSEYNSLNAAKDLHERIDPGMPSTDVECIDCGFLCYPAEEEIPATPEPGPEPGDPPCDGRCGVLGGCVGRVVAVSTWTPNRRRKWGDANYCRNAIAATIKMGYAVCDREGKELAEPPPLG